MRITFALIFIALIVALTICHKYTRKSNKAIAFSVAMLIGALIPPLIGNLIIVLSIWELPSTIGYYIYFLGMDTTTSLTAPFNRMAATPVRLLRSTEHARGEYRILTTGGTGFSRGTTPLRPALQPSSGRCRASPRPCASTDFNTPTGVCCSAGSTESDNSRSLSICPAARALSGRTWAMCCPRWTTASPCWWGRRGVCPA